MQVPVEAEVAAARASWPTLSDGLPTSLSATLAADIATARSRTGRLAVPALVDDEHGLTGPATGIGGLLRTYVVLAQRGWQFLATASGTRAGSFMRSNAPLYVYCVYDGHYDLSLLGAKLLDAYRKLGGTGGFGTALSATEVAALMRVYSPAGVRLTPHPPGNLKL